jgi:MFS transporter, Spinster family, sphingosine-1-phosphate transporter
VIRRPVLILALLTTLNLINYLDRFLVMAVGVRIQESLHLGDAQIGWVESAFMLGYFVTSPIFGWLGDRYPRKGLIAAGVAIWSVATIASGFSTSFAAMIATRVFVGIGEASYATLAPTIIDDIAEPRNRNRWLAIFYVAIPVGSALGFLLGGQLEEHFGWRSAFRIAGGPGLVLALITVLVAEPKGRPREESESAGSGLGAYLALARRPAYRATVAGYVAQTFALGGFTAWAAPFLYRKLCLELGVANFRFGLITVVTGLAGTALGGYLADRWPGQDRTSAGLRVCAWSSILGAPVALAAILVGGPYQPVGFLVALGICELAIFTSVAPINAAVMSTVPRHLRARAMAASIFAMHLLGDLISPPVIGGLSDRFGDSRAFCSGARGLELGMYLLPAALALSAVMWWRASSRPADASREDLPSADVAA